MNEDLEAYARQQYDRWGEEYQRTRDEARPERLYNEHYELPTMLEQVGDIEGKRLLDVGCGAGVHANAYRGLGARVIGCDISLTMARVARGRQPDLPISIATARSLPFNDGSFDVVTASLVMAYVTDVEAVFLELSRVLKREGRLHYSAGSPIGNGWDTFENDRVLVKGVGRILDKEKRQITLLGHLAERECTYQMTERMSLRCRVRPLRTYIRAASVSGLHLVDVRDCEPDDVFFGRDPDTASLLRHCPEFSIYSYQKV